MSDNGSLQKAELLARAMERVGFAVWQVQGLEETAATYLVVRVRGAKGMCKEKAQVLLDSARRQTFGSLVHALKEAGVLEPELAERLTACVNERNWFVHRGRRETRGMLIKPNTYNALCLKADHLAEEALNLDKELASQVVDFVTQSGVDRASIERQADRLARDWGLR